MSKIRVYELAQKMGIDNKELILRLKAVGVEVKNHMSLIDDEDTKRLVNTELKESTLPREVSKEEVRVTSTVIRKRAKVSEDLKDNKPAPRAVILGRVEIPGVRTKQDPMKFGGHNAIKGHSRKFGGAKCN